MEAPEDENGARPLRDCHMGFCRAKSANWVRFYSMIRAKQLDHWLELKTDGFEQALKTNGKCIYVCTKHFEEAETRRREAQQRLQSQSNLSFLRLVEGDVAQFRCDAIVRDVNDCLPQDDDSISEDVKPFVMELSQLSHGAVDGTVGQASEKDNNKTREDGVEILHTKGPRCATHGVATRTEEIALRGCYWNSLKTAVNRGLLQVGFPLIGTGLGGYPRSEGLMVALDTILAFFETNPVQGLNVSICVSGAGAPDVLEFGAILMGNELSFKMGKTKITKSTVQRMRRTMEKNYTKVKGLSERPRKAYQLPTTHIAFRTYVKTWNKDELAFRRNLHATLCRKQKRLIREGKSNDQVNLEPQPLDELEDDELFRDTRENMMKLAKQFTPEAEAECSTSNDANDAEDFVANFFEPSETAERIRLLKEEEVEKVENDEQKPPCLDPEIVALSMFAQESMFNGNGDGDVNSPSEAGTNVVKKKRRRFSAARLFERRKERRKLMLEAETEEQRQQRLLRRKANEARRRMENETEEEKEKRIQSLIGAAVNTKTSIFRRLGTKTEDDKQRRLTNAKENMDRRAGDPGAEFNSPRQRRLRQMREMAKRRVETETFEQYQQRLTRARESAKKRLASETEEQYERRLTKARERMRKRLAEETPEQHERRLALCRERQRRRVMGEQGQRYLAEYKERQKRKIAEETPEERNFRRAKTNARAKLLKDRLTEAQKKERNLKSAENQRKLRERWRKQKRKNPKSWGIVLESDKRRKEREAMEKQLRMESTVAGRRERYAQRRSATNESNNESIDIDIQLKVEVKNE